jgi:hypothetical protein
MMFLQADLVQVGSGVISLTTLVLVLRLTFGAGKLVEKVDGHDWRIAAHDHRLENLEAVKCPYPLCPLPLQRGHLAPEAER